MSVTITQRPTYNGYYAKNTVPKFIIETDEMITATLTMQGHSFSAIYAPDFSGKIEIDFSQLYGDYIKTLMPNGSVLTINQNQAFINCEASFTGSVSNTIPYPSGYPWQWRVFNAKLKSATGFETWVGTHFLTNQPLEKTSNKKSPEWLTWIDLNDKGGEKLKAVFYPKSGGNETQLIRQDNTAGCFTVNVSYAEIIPLASHFPSYYEGYYDIILTDGSDNLLARQRYIFDTLTGREHYYCFVNALGGIDTLICQGANTLQPELTHNIGRFGDQYTALDDTDDRRQWQQLTGQMPHKWRNWLYELLSTKQAVALYDAEEEKYQSIVVESSEISMSDHGQLAEATFGYLLDDTVNVIGDIEYQAGRSLHASVAEQAQTLDDLSSEMVAELEPDGQGGYETDELEIAATKLYVTDPRTVVSANESAVYYYLNEGETAAGSFTPGEDDMPYIITKLATDTIRFATQNEAVETLVINYYPVTIQIV